MGRRHIAILITILCFTSANAQDGILYPDSRPTYRVAFLNMENLFHPSDDSLTLDDEFTPQGSRHWTHTRAQRKMNLFWKTVSAMGYESSRTTPHAPDWPIAIGLAEVENDEVLRTLCRSFPMGTHYQYIHHDSPDPRGIDVAMLYRDDLEIIEEHAICVSDTIHHFRTRDLLQVVASTRHASDTIVFFVVHMPSQLGGTQAQGHRERIAQVLAQSMQSAQQLYPTALVMAMGDFNSSPLSLPGVSNHMTSLPSNQGTYKYGQSWDYLDQFLSLPNPNYQLKAQVFRGEWLLTEDPQHGGTKPRRTYTGSHYQEGLSDHLPIMLDIFGDR